MKNSDAVKLAKAISKVTEFPTAIEHKIWCFNPLDRSKSEYKVIWFWTNADCEIESFSTWKQLLTFCKEKWNV